MMNRIKDEIKKEDLKVGKNVINVIGEVFFEAIEHKNISEHDLNSSLTNKIAILTGESATWRNLYDQILSWEKEKSLNSPSRIIRYLEGMADAAKAAIEKIKFLERDENAERDANLN